MDAIRHYVEGVFEKLPKDSDAGHLKEEIIGDLEEKYEDYREEGYSENEALGTVIKEFGDIDEMISEMGFDQERENFKDGDEEEVNQFISETYHPEDYEVFDYLENSRKTGRFMGAGVFFILLGVSIFMFVLGLAGENSRLGQILGISAILIGVVIAVGIFIYTGMQSSKYQKFESYFLIDSSLKEEVRLMKEEYRKSYTLSLILGVSLAILSTLPVIIVGILYPNSEMTIQFTVSLLLLLIGVACFFFIYSGTVWSSYNEILKNGRLVSELKNYKKMKRNNRIYHIIENIYWPIVIIIYFVWSFSSFGWAYSWIIFVIAGFLEEIILGIFDIRGDEDDY